MAKKSLAENVFGKIMGKIFTNKVDWVMNIIKNDPELKKRVAAAAKSTNDLQKLLKKREKEQGKKFTFKNFT